MVSNNRDLINIISNQTGLGSLTSATANTLIGFNHRSMGSPVKMNQDNHGLTFFTRPYLNLTYDNIAQARKFAPLGTDDVNSLHRAIRALLDVRASTSGQLPTSLIDHQSVFIPLLSNNLLSISGWPDPNYDTYTSTEGWAKEQYSIVDDFPENYGTYDLTATFRNIEGDPINYLFFIWQEYMTRVLSGDMVPYPDMIVQNKVDYQTRIYRLVLDPTRRYVQKIAACGASFPTSNQLGASFNYSSDAVMDQSNAQISIPFRCMGAMYNDPILVDEFNKCQALVNPALLTPESREASGYVLLRPEELNYFNYEGYPYIADDYELQWWITQERYNEVMSEINAFEDGEYSLDRVNPDPGIGVRRDSGGR